MPVAVAFTTQLSRFASPLATAAARSLCVNAVTVEHSSDLINGPHGALPHLESGGATLFGACFNTAHLLAAALPIPGEAGRQDSHIKIRPCD